MMQSPFKVQLLPSECVLRMVEYLERHHLSEFERIMGELDNSDSTHYCISVSMMDLLQDDLLLGTLLLHEADAILPPFKAALSEGQEQLESKVAAATQAAEDRSEAADEKGEALSQQAQSRARAPLPRRWPAPHARVALAGGRAAGDALPARGRLGPGGIAQATGLLAAAIPHGLVDIPQAVAGGGL